jgi:hypothetical protein
MELPLIPGHVFYLTNAVGQPITWVTYQGPALEPGKVSVKIRDALPILNVDRNLLQVIPNYQQEQPEVYFAQGIQAHQVPEPQAGWANVEMQDGGRRRRTRKSKKLRLKRSRKSKATRK